MTDLPTLVKSLNWDAVEVDRGDGSSDMTGTITAESAFGQYVIDLGWGSDCYYWSTQSPDGFDLGSDFEDQDRAKAAAQADYTARILVALDPDAVAKIREDALREAAQACHDATNHPSAYACKAAIIAIIDKKDAKE
jgi:hypothetical protein